MARVAVIVAALLLCVLTTPTLAFRPVHVISSPRVPAETDVKSSYSAEDLVNSIQGVLVRDNDSTSASKSRFMHRSPSSSSTNRTYHEQDAFIFARYAAAAYCAATPRSSQSLVDWSCKACKELPKLTNVQIIAAKNTSTFGYVGYAKAANTVIVSFSGTDPLNIQNWISDLVFTQVDYAHCTQCRVHLGFWAAYLSVRDMLLTHVRKLVSMNPGAVVSVTGHSLGGALAHHAVVDLFRANVPLAFPLFNFGTPRVGNGAFAAFFYNNFGVYGMFRLVHWKDPVPQLPLNSWGFTHPPAEVYYTAGEAKSKICMSNNGEDKSCSYRDALPWLPDAIYHLQYGKFDYVSNYLSCKL